jgi:hypothetical protein
MAQSLPQVPQCVCDDCRSAHTCVGPPTTPNSTLQQVSPTPHEFPQVPHVSSLMATQEPLQQMCVPRAHGPDPGQQVVPCPVQVEVAEHL